MQGPENGRCFLIKRLTNKIYDLEIKNEHVSKKRKINK